MQRDDFETARFPSLEGYASDEAGTLDVLIATEEILGPVRNGGIASTYYHLARGLAAQGHRVTVLYLKGRQVENETPEHWIAHFAGFGIDLVYLELPDLPLFGAAVEWQARHYAFYLWLKANDRFAVVHTSEWRGGAFYCLAAKRLGLTFGDTLFIVKTSSPYIWNRHYQMRPIDRRDLLAAAFAEQKCVEWADMVVGGSAHLLSFMRHIGYRLPEGRCFVQPNIVDFSEVKVVDARPPREIGEVVRSRELVFFGRLEPRKGLELFCAAIDALVARGIAPARIIFLGKEGERISNRGDIKPIEFIEAHAEHWPIEIEIVTGLNQPEALSLMCARDMIAVMPSLIENSTMAVYETLVHRIPFVATAVGGTPELIDPADHPACLVAPDAEALAGALARVLGEGQPIARAAFDNAVNLKTWYGFHRYLAAHGPAAILGEPAPTGGEARITRIVRPRDGAELAAFARTTAASGARFDETLVCLSFLADASVRAGAAALADAGVRLIETVGASQGEAFERARAEAAGDILLFDGVATAGFEPGIGPMLRAACAARPDDLIGFAFRFDQAHSGRPDSLFLPLGGDIATHHLGNDAYGLELVAGRRESFAALGALMPYAAGGGIVHEYVARAILAGHDYMVAPEPLVAFPGDHAAIVEHGESYEYLKDMALLEGMPLAARKIWLFRGSDGRNVDAPGSELVRDSHRPEGWTVWLTDPGHVGDPRDELPRRGQVLLGFDRDDARLRAALWHRGRLVVNADDEVLIDEPAFGEPGELRDFAVEIMPLLGESDRVRIRIGFDRGKGGWATALVFRRVDRDVYLITSSEPVYWDEDFDQAFAALGGGRAATGVRARPRRRAPAEPGTSLAARLRAHMRATRRQG